MEIIKESTIEAWKTTLKLIRDTGKEVVDKDNRLSREILNIIIKINNPVRSLICYGNRRYIISTF